MREMCKNKLKESLHNTTTGSRPFSAWRRVCRVNVSRFSQHVSSIIFKWAQIIDLRKENLARFIGRCFPHKDCVLKEKIWWKNFRSSDWFYSFVSIVSMCNRGALRNCLSIGTIYPFADPLLCLCITCLEKEAAEEIISADSY